MTSFPSAAQSSGTRLPSLVRRNGPMQNSLPSGSDMVTPPPCRGSLTRLPPSSTIRRTASSTSVTTKQIWHRFLTTFGSGTFCSTRAVVESRDPTVIHPPSPRSGPGVSPSMALQKVASRFISSTSSVMEAVSRTIDFFVILTPKSPEPDCRRGKPICSQRRLRRKSGMSQS